MNQIFIFGAKLIFISMKQLFILLALLPFFAFAESVDPKYLEGAVPVVNGKVVFEKEIKLATNSKAPTFETALAWANDRFGREGCRVVYQNAEKGEIAAIGSEYIIFTNSALTLDRSMMSYQVLIYCSEQTCKLQMTNIKYEYVVPYQRKPEIYLAEEWITDKNALHKNKLNKVTGKFRSKTIDFAEDLFADAEKALGENMKEEKGTVAQPAPASKEEKYPEPQTTSSLTTSPAGYTRIEVNDVTADMQQKMQQSELRLKATESNDNEQDIQWKGFGKMFGKNIAYMSIPSSSTFLSNDGAGKTYTLQFSTKPFSQESVWMIIECAKQGETPDGERQTLIGEILNIWIK